tara:strand:- start:130795 stop:130977 length:183 start_codon:yes stop_codon:yes gene_type:complete
MKIFLIIFFHIKINDFQLILAFFCLLVNHNKVEAGDATSVLLKKIMPWSLTIASFNENAI